MLSPSPEASLPRRLELTDLPTDSSASLICPPLNEVTHIQSAPLKAPSRRSNRIATKNQTSASTGQAISPPRFKPSPLPVKRTPKRQLENSVQSSAPSAVSDPHPDITPHDGASVSSVLGPTRTPRKKSRTRLCPYPTPEEPIRVRRKPIVLALDTHGDTHELDYPSFPDSPSLRQSERRNLALEALSHAAAVALLSPSLSQPPRHSAVSSSLDGLSSESLRANQSSRSSGNGAAPSHDHSQACSAIDCWLWNRRLPAPSPCVFYMPARHHLDKACIRLLDDRF